VPEYVPQMAQFRNLRPTVSEQTPNSPQLPPG
jgi:hypothetical protein